MKSEVMRLHASLHDTAFSNIVATSHEGINSSSLVTLMGSSVQQCQPGNADQMRAQNINKRPVVVSQEDQRQEWSSQGARGGWERGEVAGAIPAEQGLHICVAWPCPSSVGLWHWS